ncbi:DUF2818 family protein [Zoogloea sp.]|uniref:DUF2818 family protein n=1 Tax=Zoogloea sp. TaxID=49181 RepID=UPI0025F3162C|nr:DUF2818 family protein [Zoogloea sp.]MCK6392227.1 DUF2818 family protein [Zoogloea sp.]
MANFVVVLGVFGLLANLPFFTPRFMGVMPMKASKVGFVLFFEVALCYLLALLGLVGAESWLEGVGYSQGWEFYVVVSCLFVVAGFPGFVHRFFFRSPVASQTAQGG